MTVTTTEADLISLPWVQTLLSAPTTTLVDTSFLRTPKASGEDSLTALTLQTPDTFRALLSVRIARETITLVSLGSGMNGHAGVLHGGIVATILDMTLAAAMDTTAAAVTAWLKVTYKKPTPAPGVVMVRSRVTRKEGRKWFLSGTLENGTGTVYAEGECMFVEVRNGRL
jgi:thioesterase superfamily protein 4